jgi:serine/threonine protein kinase
MNSLPEPSVARCRVCRSTLRDAGSIASGVCPQHGSPSPSGGDAVPHAIGPGTVLGKCKVVQELGSGGMGTVYLARHRMLDMNVAVKVLSPEVARISPAASERFLREARLAARIKHPNVVAVTDADHDLAMNISYIVMELVDGPSVGSLVAKGPLEPRDAVRIGLGVACALEAAAAHHVVHRDVKPSNVLIDSDGTVKLTDLGLAKDMDFQGKLTASAATLGTPLYMSPEQVKRAKQLDSRTDIYSLGVTLFELLTGEVPYDGASFYEVAELITSAYVPDPCMRKPDLDPTLAKLVLRMMAKEPDARPANPTEVIELLAAWLGEEHAPGAAVKVPQLASSLADLKQSDVSHADTLDSLGAKPDHLQHTSRPAPILVPGLVPPPATGPIPMAVAPVPYAPQQLLAVPLQNSPGWTYRGFILVGALICGLTSCAVMLTMHLFLRPDRPQDRHGGGRPPPPWGYGPRPREWEGWVPGTPPPPGASAAPGFELPPPPPPPPSRP